MVNTAPQSTPDELIRQAMELLDWAITLNQRFLAL